MNPSCSLSAQCTNIEVSEYSKPEASLPKPGLEALPNELLIVIIDYISIDDSQTLASLNQTNRRFHVLTRESLYARFAGPNPGLLLRTIFEKPELAEHVKEVVWTQEKDLARYCPSEVQGLIVDKLNALNVPMISGLVDEWNRYGPQDEFWYFEAFLHFVKNVERIEVHHAWHWDDHRCWFHSVAINAASHFAHLHTAILHGPMRLQNVEALLSLPSLRTFEVSQVTLLRQEQGRDFEWYAKTSMVKPFSARLPSSVEHLTFRASDVPGYLIAASFVAFKCLRSLSFEYLRCDVSLIRFHSLRASIDLTGFLERNCASLESLSLLNREEYVSHWRLPRLLPINRPLQNLRTLEFGPFAFDLDTSDGDSPLRLAMELVERLPSTLETLRLHIHYGCNDEWVGQEQPFESFLEAFAATVARGKLAMLKQFFIVGWPAWYGIFPHRFFEVYGWFANAGIHFCSIPTEFTSSDPFEILHDVEPGWVHVTLHDIMNLGK